MVETFEKEQQLRRNQLESQSYSKNLNLAASWYIAMPAKKLKQKPQAIELFSQPLVAWRNQEGHPVIMERFCAHMGASLALGKLKEGCLQCPFHHWQFDSTGECISIPEIDKIPATARQKTYVTIERYGYIWVWYGTETPLFSLPEFTPAESDKQNYMPFRVVFNLKTTVRRVMENAYDVSHFAGLHRLKTIEPVEIRLVGEQNLEQQVELSIEKDAFFGAVLEMHLQRYVGPISWLLQALGLKEQSQLLNVRQESWPSGTISISYLNNQQKAKTLAGLTPIAENKVKLHIFFGVNKTGNFIIDIANYLTFGLYSWVKTQEDVPVWNTLKPDGGGAYVKTDYEVLKFREFYQGWVDRVK